MRTRSVSNIRAAGIAVSALIALGGCAAVQPKLPPPSSKYVHHQTAQTREHTANSLWGGGGGLVEDFRARRVNDLLTINVSENISGSGAADTATGRTSTLDASVTGFFGAPLNLNKPNLYGGGNGFSPSVNGSMTDDFKGTGSTTRTGKIVGTITARVVDVMPNGTLAIESRKDITINNEKQSLILRGMVRPEDVSVSNTVESGKVADAEIYLVGDGVVQDKQRQGWLVRLLDNVWPF
jgi:flagellar L-ring protein precursor FlgH